MYQICIRYVEYCSLIRFFSIYIAGMHLLPSVFNRGFLTSYALKAINFSKTLEISIAFMYDYFIWRRTEEAITGLTRNQLTGNRPWVRIPPAAPRRSKLHIACSDFFKSQSALIALLLLSKSNPRRWASIWF